MENPRTVAGPSFVEFVRSYEPRLRRALVAWYGGEVGREATADALAWAWSNWGRLVEMDNPAGYLFRVGQSRARRLLAGRALRLPLSAVREPASWHSPWVEPGLPMALGALSPRQRAVVVLVYAFEMTHAEVAELLGIRRSTVQNHVERGLARLRRLLEVERDA